MNRPTALVTHVTQFAGPASVRCLVDAGFAVLAHDLSFVKAQARRSYASSWGDSVRPLEAQYPDYLAAEVMSYCSSLDVVVSNDSHPAVVGPIERINPTHLHLTLDALVIFPYRLVRAVLPLLKAARTGRIVFVTSNRQSLPVAGGAIPDAARAGANALVRSFSVELAPLGIAVNAVAPNFLQSETYYPRDRFVDSEPGQRFVREHVPIGRLAEQEEIGEVIRFLATAASPFMTGAIINFSGGWPAGRMLEPQVLD